MAEDLAGRISRQMDRLESPDVSAQEAAQLMQKIQFLQSLREQQP
jgi:hypothetical protein